MPHESQKDGINLTDILAMCVHDIKNELLEIMDDIEDGDAKTKIKSSSDRMIQVLALHKMGNRKYPLNVTECAVDDIISESINNSLLAAGKRSIAIEKDCDPSLFWYFDAGLVLNVLQNVLHNALKHANSRVSVRVSVLLKTELVIAIDDDGCGYPSAILDGENDDFGLNRQTGGTGFGLYFAKKVAEIHKNKQHQGRVEFGVSDHLGGASFKIYLP